MEIATHSTQRGQTITKGVPLKNKRLSCCENKPVPKEPSITDMDL